MALKSLAVGPTILSKDQQEGTHIMDETTGRKPGISRRRLTFWAMFGTVGLIMGAAYATGFVATSNTTTQTATGTATLGSPSLASPNLYGGLVSAPNPLAIGFDGYYGTVPETDMFVVDLTTADAQGHVPLAGETYYADVVVANWTALTAWDTIDLNFKVMDCTASTPGSFATASANHVLNLDRVDAHVTFSGLAGAKKYCIGVDAATPTTEAAALAADTAGGTVGDTVLFRSSTGSAPTAPQFAVTLNRSA